ncbi:hypothetical protein ACHQM5_003113 [Ranunculus cassubicifolius]
MANSLAKNGKLPIGRTRKESLKLLNQTTAAMLLPQPLDFSGIEDIREIVGCCGNGELRSLRELCAVKRTLRAARRVYQQLEKVVRDDDDGSSNRYSSLFEILQGCDFLTDLEQKIEFCIDCNLSVVLNRASEGLEKIRSERKRNMSNLEYLLKQVSTRIFQAGGIDSPIVTKRRSRMCVGIKASYRSLLRDGIILNSSSSGATYFMEPRDAVELNNMEVRLSNAERAEELAVLSMLTSEIVESESDIMYLLEKIQELDLVSARAAYAQWIGGVCPIINQTSERLNSSKSRNSLLVDIEGIQHPVLLEASLKSSTQELGLDSGNLQFGNLSERKYDFPVPIDIKIGRETKVVVISGPNTGGKTASMKTLGLASLMSKAGLYLPAKKQPRLPWFDIILADIGDHQSLEQSLSTFSGHISRIRRILELGSKRSLVLIDEIGSGTDPSEGVALSASILQYLKDRVNLAVVTTHYADLSLLREKDSRFENAAMEFSLETLQPTYHILWGCIGNSNALSIAKSIGFDLKVLDRAHKWVEKLMPDKQMERKGMLFHSLMEERTTLEAQAKLAVSLHSEVMKLYQEINGEAEDLDGHEMALKLKEIQEVQQGLKAARMQMDEIITKCESQLKNANPDQFNSLVRKAESSISSIIEAHRPSGAILVSGTHNSSYIPQVGEQVIVKGLGGKLANIVEAPGDDGMALVQYGKMKVRVNKNKLNAIKPTPSTKRTTTLSGLKGLAQVSKVYANAPLEADKDGDSPFGPVVQTSRNTVDLRGMRVEEADNEIRVAIATSRSRGVLFIIHGIGTGVLKERVTEILKNHPRVAKFEWESAMNDGCTVAFIK